MGPPVLAPELDTVDGAPEAVEPLVVGSGREAALEGRHRFAVIEAHVDLEAQVRSREPDHDLAARSVVAGVLDDARHDDREGLADAARLVGRAAVQAGRPLGDRAGRGEEPVMAGNRDLEAAGGGRRTIGHGFLILQRNPIEQLAGLAAVGRNLRPQRVDRLEAPLVAQPSNEPQSNPEAIEVALAI